MHRRGSIVLTLRIALVFRSKKEAAESDDIEDSGSAEQERTQVRMEIDIRKNIREYHTE